MDDIGVLADALPVNELGPDRATGNEQPCASPRCEPTVRQRNFSMQSPDALLHFQILDLGRQYFVWVSAVGPKLDNLTLAIQTPSDKVPAVASLLPGGSGAAGEGPAMAQRLALKLQKPVVCSVHLPPNAPLLQAVAERRLMQELKAMEEEEGSAQAQQQEQGQGQEQQGQGQGQSTAQAAGAPAEPGAQASAGPSPVGDG